MIDVSYTETPQSCSSICQSIPGCLWFTHDFATKGCYSLKDCIPVFDCPTCISGEVNCPYKEGIHQNLFPYLSRFVLFSMLFPVFVPCFPSSLKQEQCAVSRKGRKFSSFDLKFVQPFLNAVVLLSRTGKASNSHFERFSYGKSRQL